MQMLIYIVKQRQNLMDGRIIGQILMHLEYIGEVQDQQNKRGYNAKHKRNNKKNI